MIATARAIARIGALTVLTLSSLAIYGASFWCGAKMRRGIVRAWHASAARIVGIHIRAQGIVAPAGSLIACNHVSYIDVIALGALTEATFVAKASVARWPVIGFLARLVNTLFVDRTGSHCLSQIQAISRMLTNSQSVILFPEGTSTAGRTVLGFKSTLFAATQSAENPVMVQPVTIAYAKGIDGWDLPIDERRIHPWIGEDELVPHLWSMLKHRGVVADVQFHAPVAAHTFASRKDLAEHCQRASAHGLVVARRRTALPAVTDAEEWLKAPLFGLLG
jgi:1-acyl-sn-glycerol-3-phosphate acyltransferase